MEPSWVLLPAQLDIQRLLDSDTITSNLRALLCQSCCNRSPPHIFSVIRHDHTGRFSVIPRLLYHSTTHPFYVSAFKHTRIIVVSVTRLFPMNLRRFCSFCCLNPMPLRNLFGPATKHHCVLSRHRQTLSLVIRTTCAVRVDSARILWSILVFHTCFSRIPGCRRFELFGRKFHLASVITHFLRLDLNPIVLTR